MANLTVQAPFNPNRPTDIHLPNGIAHSRSVNNADTKTDRAVAKRAWARYVQDYKAAYMLGDSSGPAIFPKDGTIIYPND